MWVDDFWMPSSLMDYRVLVTSYYKMRGLSIKATGKTTKQLKRLYNKLMKKG